MNRSLLLAIGLAATASLGCLADDGGDEAYNDMLTSMGAAGSNCPGSGIKIATGPDINGNGVLDSDEIAEVEYVCSDADGEGEQTLVSTSTEAPGENCPAGGQRIEFGVDDDRDNTLDADEVDRTTYLCYDLQSLMTTTDEPVGENCITGGQRVDYGIDDNGDGVLDPLELDDTAYFCNLENPVTFLNGDFETGNFDGWMTKDLTSPNMALQTGLGLEGDVGVLTGFEGNGGPGNDKIFVAQDVDLTGTGVTSVSFDWAVPVCHNFGGRDRVFSLEIEPAGGGAPMFSQTIFTCRAKSSDSNPAVDDQSIDISSVANQPVRVKFQWLVPESNTGDALAQLDDIKLF